MNPELRLAIPAKVNLHLEVVGRRPDGFHELRTVFQSVDLRDVVSARAADDGLLDLVVTPEDALPVTADNLILRAAGKLREIAGRPLGARLRLEKSIPVGGGMGGGSADAAATLVLLDRLWGLGLNPAELHRLAAELGSDVPFFLHGGLAVGFGRGEEVIPLADLPALAIVLVVPRIEVATKTVFAALAPRTWKRLDDRVYAGLVGRSPAIDWSAVTNDLEDVVLRQWPEVETALRALRANQPLCAAVSGSGATVFAAFDTMTAARRAATNLGDGPWRVEVVETLGRERARPIVERDKGSSGVRWRQGGDH